MRFKLATIVLVGCSSFGEAPPAPAPPTSDAGPIVDAGEDAAPAVIDAGAARFCERAPVPARCADFEGAALGEWQSAQHDRDIGGSSVVEVSPDSAHDGAVGLHVRLPAGGSIIQFDQVYREYQSLSFADAYLEASVRIRRPSSAWSYGDVAILTLEYTNQGDALVQAKAKRKDDDHVLLSMYVRGKDGGGVESGSIVATYDTWLRVRLEARLVQGAADAGTDGSGRLVVTGSDPVSETVTRGSNQPSSAALLARSEIGLTRYDTVTNVALDIDYDDIVGGPL